jgi:transcriptional regulator with XRE-family HTH domain
MNWNKNEIKKSWPCNGDLMRYIREKRGWTQQDLADKSGYSKRLVSKAESGSSISAAAIEIFAETLSSDVEKWIAEDLTCDPLTFAKRYAEAIYTKQAGTYSAIESMLHPECVFYIAGDPGIIPFAGCHKGLRQIESALELMFIVLEIPDDHDYRPWYTFAANGNESYLWGKTWIHPKGNPFDEPMDIQHRFVFQEGKLILLEDRFDTDKAHKSLT